MAQRFYDFSEYSVGDLGTHWAINRNATTQWTAKVYTDGGATGGKLVRLESNAGGSGFFTVRNTEIGSVAGDLEIVARFRSLGAAGGAGSLTTGVPFGIGMLAVANTGKGYGPMPYGGNWYGQYWNSDGQAWGNLGGPYTGSAVAVDTWYWGRFGRSGTTIRGKIWTGTAGDEPGGWQFSATDTNIADLYAGLMSFYDDFEVDVFGIGTGSGVSAPTSTPAPGVDITNAGDEVFENGESITITGSGFGASQGVGKVYISPSDDIADAGRVEQTVTAWADTSITITVARGGLSFLTNHYLFVKNNALESNAGGYSVQIEPKVYVRRALVDPDDGTPVASLSGLTMHIWRGAITGAPDQTVSSVSTDGSGVLSQKITRGSLVVDDPVWVVVAKDGSPGNGGILNLTPSYE